MSALSHFFGKMSSYPRSQIVKSGPTTEIGDGAPPNGARAVAGCSLWCRPYAAHADTSQETFDLALQLPIRELRQPLFSSSIYVLDCDTRVGAYPPWAVFHRHLCRCSTSTQLPANAAA